MPPLTIEIEGDKKTAKAKHDATQHEQSTLCIYTDGSGIEGRVGAVAFCPNTSQTALQYLGSDEEQ
jgi:hypothetical protein